MEFAVEGEGGGVWVNNGGDSFSDETLKLGTWGLVVGASFVGIVEVNGVVDRRSEGG